MALEDFDICIISMASHTIILYIDNRLLSDSIQTMLGLNKAIRLIEAYENPKRVETHLQEYHPDSLIMDYRFAVLFLFIRLLECI